MLSSLIVGFEFFQLTFCSVGFGEFYTVQVSVVHCSWNRIVRFGANVSHCQGHHHSYHPEFMPWLSNSAPPNCDNDEGEKFQADPPPR